MQTHTLPLAAVVLNVPALLQSVTGVYSTLCLSQSVWNHLGMDENWNCSLQLCKTADQAGDVERFACCSWGKQCLFTTPCFIQLVLHLHEFSPEFPSCVPRWLTFSAWVELRSNQNTEVNRRYKWFPLCLWLDMVALWDSTESVFMMLPALSDLSTLLLLVWRALLMLRGRLYLQWRLWSHHMWHSKRFWIRVISGCWWYWTITGIHRAHVPT